MPRRLPILVLLLAVETGCPHTWRKGGAVDMMIERNMWEGSGVAKRPCQMDLHEWNEKCRGFKNKTREEKFQCPKECQPVE
ncbi:hypothetical protein ACN28E_20810 [Archangium lansingense]|uniref:hypothetical protein n=1 Tax=Archangium lansingense TaxID=2995310 RepID=UPI003B820568